MVGSGPAGGHEAAAPAPAAPAAPALPGGAAADAADPFYAIGKATAAATSSRMPSRVMPPHPPSALARQHAW
jgi:hypothetical protein